ncbi:MAG TPA: ribonuclease HI [Trichocoleus sp.]|jgi:ribonuclease HI
MAQQKIQRIYTDGACSGNPGPGGWGTVVYFDDGSIHELGGADPQTTNNRMEMQAAIAALEFLVASGQTEPVTLYTDSEYVKNGVTKWIKGWKQKGWKTSTGKPVLNQDLWEMLDRLNQQASHTIRAFQWQYVRGHSGDAGNERCDTIARAFSLGKLPSLQQATRKDSEEKEMPKRQSATHVTNQPLAETVESSHIIASFTVADSTMVDSINSSTMDGSDLPREVRVAQLRSLVDTLRMSDEIAREGYLITSSELADLMDVNASAVTSRGDNWVWRNWVVSRVRREGNQILWQLERVD